MTKASIVQKLLDAGHITAEEAVVLLTNENYNGITYIPYNPYYPNNPDWTYDPNRPGQPYWYTTSTSGGGTEPFEYPDTKWPGDKNS